MSTQTNADLVRRYFIDVWRDGDLEIGRRLIVDDYKLHRVPAGDEPGFDTWRTGVAFMRSVFADIRFDHQCVVAEGDLVAVRSLMRGRHVAAFMGVEPTGREVAVPFADFYRVVDGRLVEHWDVVDLFTLLAQLGALPPELDSGTVELED